MYRIGVDVGGTFTDLVAVDDFGKATLAKVPSTPEDPSVGVLDGLKLLAEMLGTELVGAAGRNRAGRAWDDGRDQRAARAQGRAGRAVDDRRPSRRDRDARGAEGRPLQSAPAAARTAGSAQIAARRARAAARRRPRRDAARPCVARSRRRRAEARTGRGCRGLLPARLPRPAARARDQGGDRKRAARNLRLAVLGSAPADQGVREGLDDRRQRLCRTGLVALSGAARAKARGSRLRRPDVDHSVAWRRRADCRVPGAWRPEPCCPARPAASPAASMPRDCSENTI